MFISSEGNSIVSVGTICQLIVICICSAGRIMQSCTEWQLWLLLHVLSLMVQTPAASL